jgi:hypothetical protein
LSSRTMGVSPIVSVIEEKTRPRPGLRASGIWFLPSFLKLSLRQ